MPLFLHSAKPITYRYMPCTKSTRHTVLTIMSLLCPSPIEVGQNHFSETHPESVQISTHPGACIQTVEAFHPASVDCHTSTPNLCPVTHTRVGLPYPVTNSCNYFVCALHSCWEKSSVHKETCMGESSPSPLPVEIAPHNMSYERWHTRYIYSLRNLFPRCLHF